jgi:hypothetical protein
MGKFFRMSNDWVVRGALEFDMMFNCIPMIRSKAKVGCKWNKDSETNYSDGNTRCLGNYRYLIRLDHTRRIASNQTFEAHHIIVWLDMGSIARLTVQEIVLGRKRAWRTKGAIQLGLYPLGIRIGSGGQADLRKK